MSVPRPLHFMLLDANEPDSQLVMSALEMVTPVPEFTVFQDSAAALAYLQSEDQQIPDLLLMSLYLSPLSGMDVLVRIKAYPNLRQLPVVILSSSELPEEVDACYAAQATMYLVRPASWFALEEQMQELWSFWNDRLRFNLSSEEKLLS